MSQAHTKVKTPRGVRPQLDINIKNRNKSRGRGGRRGIPVPIYYFGRIDVKPNDAVRRMLEARGPGCTIQGGALDDLYFLTSKVERDNLMMKGARNKDQAFALFIGKRSMPRLTNKSTIINIVFP